MEYPGGGGAVLSGGNVPAFLTKLWTLVEDPDTDPLICWSPSGTSFHVFDQGRFSKEVLPKFFKHNNMASFIRQLNMYGFRKVVHIEQGGLVKPERDDTEFQHPFFIRGQEHLLENIKRKVTNVSSVRQDDAKICTEEVNKILNDVQLMKGKQETIDSRIVAMKHENEALWREVASLRQKHAQQQKVVNKLIQFLVSLIQSNRLLGVKRKIPLMLNDSGSTHSMPKYNRTFSLEQAAANLFSADTSLTSGPIISDITDMATPTADEVVSDWTDQGESPSVDIKEEPSSPEVEVCPVLEEVAAPVDTPLSPTTFINSILEENEAQPTPVTSTSTAPTAASPIVVMSPASTGPRSSAPSSQSLASVTTAQTAPSPTTPQQKCQAIACIDKPRPLPSAGGLSPDVWRFLSAQPDKCELSDHVGSIDNGLENLQNLLNTQTFTFDTTPLIEFFSSSGPSADFDLDSLDNLLSDEAPKGSEESGTGKQLVQYTPVQTSEPVSLVEGGADLPSLLELEAEPFLSSDLSTEDPATALLSHANLDSDL
ncbi:heat shock factor protein 1 isoform X1 [Archocentrus centrarchus]|uniref:heat shock factor protein 1 isoform X1 n=1 Tax=Archocentrus centrarchus TaxID=63155 RepID=UPI0011EA3CF2|nr:heat shock factor protein 1 isoform X1 [Archocentrus centrarchus]